MEVDSIQAILNAIKHMKSKNSIRRKTSLQLLSSWFNQPTFADRALSIIKITADNRVRHAVGMMMIPYIMNNWMSIEEEVKNNICEYFHEQVTNKELSDDDSYIFKRILSLVALYEYPENWNSFLVDILYVDPNSDNFLPNMQLLAQFTFEVSHCNFLTSDRVIRLQQLILTFFDLYSSCIRILLEKEKTVPFGLSILASLLSWGKAPDILSPELFPLLLMNIKANSVGLTGSINCLCVAFFGRNDVEPMFGRMPLLLHQFAQLEEHNTMSLAFISRFLFKYLNHIERLYSQNKDLAKDITKLFEATLQKEQCDDFWRLWRSVLQRVSKPITQDPTLSFIQPIIPLVFEKMTAKLQDNTEYGRIKNVDAQVFFGLLVKRFHNETIDFLKKTSPNPATIYLASILDPKINKEFVNEYLARVIPENQSDSFSEPLLFLLSRASEILDDPHIAHFSRISEELLSSSNQSLQISAARALLVAFDAAPKRFDANAILEKCLKFVLTACETAVVLIFRLCATIASMCNIDFSIISNILLEMIQSEKVAVALLALKTVAFASGDKCHLLFEHIWTPLLSLLGSKHEIEFLAFDAVGAAVVNCKLSDIERPFNEIKNLIFSRPDLTSLSYNFLALVRVEKPELDSLRPQIEELIAKSHVYSSLFQMLSVFNPLTFNKKLVLTKLVEGIGSSRSDVASQAVMCASTLIFALAENDSSEKEISYFRKPLVCAVIKATLEPRCKGGFDRRAEFLNEVFSMCGTKQAMEEFIDALNEYCQEPKDGFFEMFMEHLNQVKCSAFDFRVSLRDFVLVIKRKVPLQMEMFPTDDEQSSDTDVTKNT